MKTKQKFKAKHIREISVKQLKGKKFRRGLKKRLLEVKQTELARRVNTN